MCRYHCCLEGAYYSWSEFSFCFLFDLLVFPKGKKDTRKDMYEFVFVNVLGKKGLVMIKYSSAKVQNRIGARNSLLWPFF